MASGEGAAVVSGFIVRMLITAFALWLAQALIPGVIFTDAGSLFLAALLLGIVNAIVRPILIVLTLPITILTLGLFLLVINAAMLTLVARLMSGFELAGFGSAILASIVVSLTSWAASWTIGPKGRYEVMIVERRG